MSKISALVIDDNQTNIRVIQQFLSMEDVICFTLTSTRNLSEALDAISGVRVVFLDLEMPNLNGFDALPIIKQHPNFRNAMVIAYSVHISELNDALEAGFDGFLGKPLSAEDFPEQLQRILNGERVRYVP